MNDVLERPNYTDALVKEFTFKIDPMNKIASLAKIELGTRILEDIEEDLDFLEIAFKIETSQSVVEQQQLALAFIESHPEYPKSFKHATLKQELKRVKSWQPKNCRYAYMLQYSIPLTAKLRNANYRPYNWIQRLMVFSNTYIVEDTVVGKFYGKFKFLYRTKGKNKVVDHNILEYGPGEELADFYFWDKANKKLFASVDLKCNFNGDSIDTVIATYATERSRHWARFVLSYNVQEQKYYMIDYENQNRSEEINLPLPPELFDIHSF